MIRLSSLAVLLFAASALATGERIVLEPELSPLKDTLCLSMECVTGKPDAVVTTKAVKGGLEVTVTAGGQRRLTFVSPARSDGSVSSTELVRATALVVKAIEQAPAPAPVATPLVAPRGRMFARR